MDYLYGDDNEGNFILPSITLCPSNFGHTFAAQLKENCQNLTTIQSRTFLLSAEQCAKSVPKLQDFFDLVDFKIKNILKVVILGRLIIVTKNLEQFWRQNLHYKFGFCWTLDTSQVLEN